MFSKVVCCRGVVKRLDVGKGLTPNTFKLEYIRVRNCVDLIVKWYRNVPRASLYQICFQVILFRKKNKIHRCSWRAFWDMWITISHIPHICSRRLLKHLDKNLKNLYRWRLDFWKELKTLWQKEKLFVLSNFTFCHYVFKRRMLQRHHKVYTYGKGIHLLVP